MTWSKRSTDAATGLAFRGAHRLALGLLFSLLATLTPGRAEAWIESTVIADEVRVQVDRNGTALVDHALTVRVRGAPLRVFALAGVDPDAALEGPLQVAPQREGASLEGVLPVIGQVLPDAALRLEVDDPRGVAKGVYVFRFRYRTDLVKSGALERDGAMLRLRWLGPKLPNGLDAARCTLSLPTSPGEPRAATDRRDGDLSDDDGLSLSGAGAFLTTSRRFPDHDEIELLRPHVARGEQVAWTARLDPRALGAVNDPRLRPPPAAAVQSVVQHRPRERQVFLAVAAGLAILFSALTGIKAGQVEETAGARQVRPRPLVPLRSNLRALLAGPLVAIGVGLQLLVDPPWCGTVALLFAMALMAYRAPLTRPVARAPGRWLPLSDADAFRAPKASGGGFLDLSSGAGKGAALLALGALGAAAYATYRVSPFHANLVGLDGLLLLSLFATGRASELPPSPATGPSSMLRRVARRLRRASPGLRAVGLGRFAQGASEHDELRLLVMPRTPLRGLLGIEIGYAYLGGAGGFIGCPEILVRLAEESEAEAKARRLAPFGRWVRGRRPGELVLTLEPRFGSWRMTAELAQRLGRILTEPSARRAQSASRASSSGGKGEVVRKAGTSGSPLQVTDAAWSA